MRKRSAKEVPRRPGIPQVAASTASRALAPNPHRMELEVQHQLLSHPELNFSSLVVRRIHGGVCLEGVLEVEDDAPDVCRLARQIAGVELVLNHLVLQHPRFLPAKG